MFVINKHGLWIKASGTKWCDTEGSHCPTANSAHQNKTKTRETRGFFIFIFFPRVEKYPKK